jgi:hypothetical protein
MYQRSSALPAVCFTAGVIGALFNSLALWWSGAWNLTAMAGVAIAPDLTLDWLYPRLVWGGLWALVFWLFVASPRSRRQWVRKGLLVSLLPTAVQLFYIFPYHTPHDTMGMALGTFTPLFVLVFNAVWGVFTAVFTRLFWGRG